MDPILAEIGVCRVDWCDPVASAGIVLVALVVALVFHRVLFPLILRFTRWTPTDLDSRMVRSARWPFTIGIVVLGVYLALTLQLDLTTLAQHRVDNVAEALGVVLGIFLVVGLLSSVVDWYLAMLAARSTHVVDLRLFPLLRRVGVVIIYVIGALLVLDVLEINISPLIAGLGLGGLAVALALQPTLANLFAGTYVMTEGVISPGDYIELEGGMAGYVVEVGWRSTRIRTWGNNLVVVPNARFAETIITNYQEPVPAVNVYLVCGVSYDSDLDRVEAISREVMENLIATTTTAVREYGSWFAFDSFGESNVNFWLFLQARDRIASFTLQSDLIKDLHRRFREESIVINYPMRTLQFPDGWSPQLAAGQAPPSSAGELRSRPGRTQPPRDFNTQAESEEAPDGGGPDGPA